MKKHSIQSIAGGSLLALLISGTTWAAEQHGHDHGYGPANVEMANGKPGMAVRVKRTIEVVMSDDMRFTPSDIQVRRGETVRFLIRNAGQIRHEFSLGTRQELDQHYAQMKNFPDMVHDEPGKVSLEPGRKAEVVFQFDHSGVVDFACLQVGHYEAGMKGQIRVGD